MHLTEGHSSAEEQKPTPDWLKNPQGIDPAYTREIFEKLLSYTKSFPINNELYFEIMNQMCEKTSEESSKHPENSDHLGPLLFFDIYSMIVLAILESDGSLQTVPARMNDDKALRVFIRHMANDLPNIHPNYPTTPTLQKMAHELLKGDEATWDLCKVKIMRCAIDHLTLYWNSYSKQENEKVLYVKDTSMLPYIHQESFPEPSLDLDRMQGLVKKSMLIRYVSEKKEKSPNMVGLFMIFSMCKMFNEKSKPEDDALNLEDFIREIRESVDVDTAAGVLWSTRCKAPEVPPMPERYVDKVRNSSIALIREIYRELANQVFRSDYD